MLLRGFSSGFIVQCHLLISYFSKEKNKLLGLRSDPCGLDKIIFSNSFDKDPIFIFVFIRYIHISLSISGFSPPYQTLLIFLITVLNDHLPFEDLVI